MDTASGPSRKRKRLKDPSSSSSHSQDKKAESGNAENAQAAAQGPDTNATTSTAKGKGSPISLPRFPSSSPTSAKRTRRSTRSPSTDNQMVQPLDLRSSRGARAAMMEADRRAAIAEHATSSSTQHIEAGPSTSETHKDLATLRAEMASLTAQVESLRDGNQLREAIIERQRSALTYLHGQVTCNICFELVWRPQVLSPCGHTFCARCLLDWFQRPVTSEQEAIPSHLSAQERRMLTIRNNHRRRKYCPHCRTEAKTAPAEVWSLKSIVERLHQCSTSGLITHQDPSDADFSTPRTVEDERRMRGIDLATGEDLWKDIFDSKGPARAFMNEGEGAWHCSECGYEIVDGTCIGCGQEFPDLADDEDGHDDVDLDESDIDRALDGDDADDGSPWTDNASDLLEQVVARGDNVRDDEDDEMDDFIVWDEGDEDDGDDESVSSSIRRSRDATLELDVDGLPPPVPGGDYDDEEEDEDEDDSDTQEVEGDILPSAPRRGRRNQPIVVDSEEDDEDGGDDGFDEQERDDDDSDEDDEEEDGVEEALHPGSYDSDRMYEDEEEDGDGHADGSYDGMDDDGHEYDDENGADAYGNSYEDDSHSGEDDDGFDDSYD